MMLAIAPAAKVMPVSRGVMADFSDDEFPTVAYGITTDKGAPPSFLINGPGTAFGYVADGTIGVVRDGAYEDLEQGTYFSIPVNKQAKILTGQGDGFIAFRKDYRGLNIRGYGLEERGRLRYIDGCSDTLLIAPPLRGDPCLNLLHFPRGISQTKHTHPSIRIGMIHKGWGLCHTAQETAKLATGSIFILWPEAIHAFETTESDMQLTVFHPDSDFGPTHEEHPMLNRTIVDGVSAKHIDAIRTKELS